MPGAPPLDDSKSSRIVYHDLASNGDLDRLRGSGTAFVPHAVRIERSPVYGHLDAPYIESITFGSKPCRALVPENEFLEEYTDESIQNNSRAQVSFFSDADKPDCALAVPIVARTYYNANEQCNSELQSEGKKVRLMLCVHCAKRCHDGADSASFLAFSELQTSPRRRLHDHERVHASRA